VSSTLWAIRESVRYFQGNIPLPKSHTPSRPDVTKVRNPHLYVITALPKSPISKVSMALPKSHTPSCGNVTKVGKASSYTLSRVTKASESVVSVVLRKLASTYIIPHVTLVSKATEGLPLTYRLLPKSRSNAPQ